VKQVSEVSVAGGDDEDVKIVQVGEQQREYKPNLPK